MIHEQRARVRVAETLLLAAGAAGLLALVLVTTGGFTVRLAGFDIRAHHPGLLAGIALVCLFAAWGAGSIPGALAVLWDRIERRGAAMAAVAAAAALCTGVIWGTHVAGGSDSYCYLNQAELLAHGDIRERQPLVRRAPWEDRLAPFVTVGHIPAAGVDDAIVPMCAAGYPLIMAAARTIAGRAAMFWVVPLFGGLAVWLTFLLGRRIGGAACGAMAACLLASSPTFLFQIVQPMTDVPAAALWTAALLLACPRDGADPTWKGSLATGMVTGLALLVRPNLLPLAAVIAAATLWHLPLDWRATGRRLIGFSAGVVPFIVAIAALQTAMYGGPLKSGYGRLDELFAFGRVAPNLERYVIWLIQTETVFVALALVAPWVVRETRARPTVWRLLIFSLAVLGCYLPYGVFDAWWYLRFVLPAIPPLLALSSAVALTGISRLPYPSRTVLVLAVVGLLVAWRLGMAVDRSAFDLWDLERRFRDGGEYVATRLPENAAIVTVTESGSVRFYSGRLTVLWNSIEPEWLDRSIAFLEAEGYHPYLLFETLEEPVFRKRFEKHSRLGGLEWPPIAQINRAIRIYDPADFDRYMRGGSVRTDRVWTRQPNR